VVISNSVTSIDDSAFYGCSNLTNVAIPNSVTSIGSYAFAYCSNLTSLVIPNSVTSIGNYAFYGCSNLSTITIPASVTSIGKNETFGATGIKTVYCYKGSVADDISLYPDGAQIIYLDSIQTESTTITTETTTESTTTTTESTTESTTEAISVTGGNIYFDPDTQQIVGCDSFVTAIEIPESVNGVVVSGISEKAFADCIALESISIPNSIKTVSKNTFANCTSLKTITCEKGSVADNAELYPTSTEITYTEPEFISGDASGDGQLTAEDAALVLQKSLNLAFVTGIEEKTTDYIKYLDVSGDGSITADDAAQILQKTLDKSFKFSSEA
jgi:hypothetical protein